MAVKTDGHSLINPSINICIHVSNFYRAHMRVRAPDRNGHCNKLFFLHIPVLVRNTLVVVAEPHKPLVRVRMLLQEAFGKLPEAHIQHRDEDL